MLLSRARCAVSISVRLNSSQHTLKTSTRLFASFMFHSSSSTIIKTRSCSLPSSSSLSLRRFSLGQSNFLRFSSSFSSQEPKSDSSRTTPPLTTKPTTMEKINDDRVPPNHFSLKARALRFGMETCAVIFGVGSSFITLLLVRPFIPELPLSMLTWQSIIAAVGIGAYFVVSSRSPYMASGYKFPVGKFGTRNPFWMLIAGFVAGTLMQLLVGAVAEQDEDPLLRQLGITGHYVPHMVFMGPFIEELVFRWILFGRIFQSVGVVPAYLCGVPLFGLAHYSENSAKVLASGVAGLIFTLVYHATGRLWVPLVLHSVSNGLACGYFYLLNPFVENREARLYTHYFVLFLANRFYSSVRLGLATKGWGHDRVDRHGHPTPEVDALLSRLCSRLSKEGGVVDSRSFGKLMHFLPDIQNEVADALVVLLSRENETASTNARELLAQNCTAYINDVNSAMWRAAFGEKSQVDALELKEFLFKMCLEDGVFLVLKELDTIYPEPLSFTYSFLPPKKDIGSF